MSANTGYQGWRNRATWNAYLWLGNDEPLYRESVALGKTCAKGAPEFPKLLRLFCHRKWGAMTPDQCPLDDVDWVEVANVVQG